MHPILFSLSDSKYGGREYPDHSLKDHYKACAKAIVAYYEAMSHLSDVHRSPVEHRTHTGDTLFFIVGISLLIFLVVLSLKTACRGQMFLLVACVCDLWIMGSFYWFDVRRYVVGCRPFTVVRSRGCGNQFQPGSLLSEMTFK